MNDSIRVKKPETTYFSSIELKRKPTRIASDEQPEKIYWLHRTPKGNLTLRGSSS
jgi:hypothetical protein